VGRNLLAQQVDSLDFTVHRDVGVHEPKQDAGNDQKSKAECARFRILSHLLIRLRSKHA